MSLFNASNCQFEGDDIVNRIAWSRVDQLAALSTYTVDENDQDINQVYFTNAEGELVSKPPITHDYEATVFDWHPTERVVAIGWGDGMVSCWSVDGKNRPTSLYTNNNQHNGAITVLKWNPLGKRLVTGDKKGVICVWTADSKGILTPSRQYKKKGEITSIIFCLMSVRINDTTNPGSRSKNEVKTQMFSPYFFFGTDRGAVVYADDLGHCTDVQQLSSSIDSMMFFEEKSRLIIITRTLLLTQYHVTDDGRVSKFMQVKLSVPGDIAEKGIKSLVWAGPGLLAVATEEKIVRLFDLAADESYNISLNSALGDVVNKLDRVTCVAFNPIDRYLAIGTTTGLVAIWKFTGAARSITSDPDQHIPATSPTDWEFIFKVTMNSPILQLAWHWGKGTLGVVTDDGTVILNESILHSGMAGELSVIQISSHEVSLHLTSLMESFIMNTGVQIKGLAVGRSCFVVWSGKIAKVYRVDIQMQKCDPLEPLKSNGIAMAIADASYIVDEAWFVADGSTVKINNFTGTQKGAISFSEAEGIPEHLDINNKYLAIVTNKGVAKVIDVHTPTKPKQLGSAGQFFTSSMNPATMRIRSIKINSSGTRVAILADFLEGSLQVCHPDTKLYVFDRSKGEVITYDFAPLKRSPVSVYWDDGDDRLLSCEAMKNRAYVDNSNNNKNNSIANNANNENELQNNANNNNNHDSDAMLDNEVEVYLFFATSEHGIMMQDSFPRKHPFGSMIGVTVPRLYFRNAPANQNVDENGEAVNASNNKAVKIYSKVMRDFVGMDEVDEKTKNALLDFSYNLTLGKLDEAYRAVKAISNSAIWENMAQMCVKTKRLDVAEVCLGNMGHARGAAAVREAKKEGNVEVTIGVLAIQLGLLDDAARLFRESGRYDMLNRLYQSAGLWDKAIQTATTKDRIHLKTTHYQFAKHLESIGCIDEAIDHYQRSDNARTEVPRMLFNMGRVEELSEYVLKSDDAVLLKWWAAYLESIERFDKAKKYYQKANDYLSLVRICCFKGDFNKAAEIVNDSGDRASAYHFARQLENQGEYQEAINFYASSGCYNHCIRLAKTHNYEQDVMRYALKSTPALMIECAQYFEEKGIHEKAIQLYHRGGDISRALDLCFRVGEEEAQRPKERNKEKEREFQEQRKLVFDMLNTIAQDLGKDSSPVMLARCADFLVEHKQFEKAIELFVMAKKYLPAIDLCISKKVNITEDMVEKMTPPDTEDASLRKETLLRLAKALKAQGSYTLASKKYTQAGDRVGAIRCLVKSGDTKAVISFASISRNNEIYKLAANHLQQMNWRESEDIMKAIVSFYTRAKAYLSLATFYEGCATVEIDEFQNYEKAVSALKIALSHAKNETSSEGEAAVADYENRIRLIGKFVQARKVLKSDPNEMISICESLLQEPMLEKAMKAGDCFAMLIEYYHGEGKIREAYQYIQEMQERRIPIGSYLESNITDEIFRAMGINNNKNNSNNRMNSVQMSNNGANAYSNNTDRRENEDDEQDEELDEEIGEEMDEDEKEDSPVKKGNKFGNYNNRGNVPGNNKNNKPNNYGRK